MNDVKYEILKAILEYMYLGEVHITNDNLKEFIKTAEGLQIRGLSKDMHNVIIIRETNYLNFFTKSTIYSFFFF